MRRPSPGTDWPACGLPASSLHPTAEWTAEQARDLVMGPGDEVHMITFMIRDRGPDFPAAFGAVLAGAGIRAGYGSVQAAHAACVSHENKAVTRDSRSRTLWEIWISRWTGPTSQAVNTCVL